MKEMPVIVPPGCAMLATKWSAIQVAGQRDDGDRGSCIPHRDQRSAADEDNDVHPKLREFSCEVFQVIYATLAKPIFDEDVLAFDVTQVA